MESRGRLRLSEKAEIIELYIGRGLNIYQIAPIVNRSQETVNRTVSLYFKKPKKNVVKPSRV